jgi:hypothetical protein
VAITPLAGAFLLICGVVMMARAAIARGRLSDPNPKPNDPASTLEPRHRGTGFLGLGANGPGLALVVLGGLLLLLPLIL